MEIRRAQAVTGWAAFSVRATILLISPLCISQTFAGAPIRLAGQLSGMVTDTAGRPQSGASVILLNRQEKVLQRVGTDISGNFSFDDLLPDLYSVRISFSTFVPAIREFVAVKPGMRSLLAVNLSKVLSSVQVIATMPAPNGLMNDDWKWTLRADSSLRPILRMFPAQAIGDSERGSGVTQSGKTAMFSSSRGLVRLSASDGAQSVDAGGEADLGTQFAFGTSFYGDTNLTFSGNLGYGSVSSLPAAVIRTTFEKDFAGTTPSVSVTMRQISGAIRNGQSSTDNPVPTLRSISFSFADKAKLGDFLSLEYGTDLDMVSFFDRLSYFSPYARLKYALSHGTVDFTYTSGNARPELGLSGNDQAGDLQRDLAAISLIPRVTLNNGQAKVQRGDDYEAGITERFGSREYRVAVYNESVSNNTLTIAHAPGGLFPNDLVPDIFSDSALFNAGHFDSTGYTASVTQDLGDDYKITASYGTVGVMAPRVGGPPVSSADDLRRLMESGQRQAVTLRAAGTVRKTGTRFVTSYQWTDYAASLPGPQFLTQSARPGPGLNFMVRQRIPNIPGLPWRIEASAEMRNLLAQGYLPVNLANGQQLLLVNTPRSVRGGLAFVF